MFQRKVITVFLFSAVLFLTGAVNACAGETNLAQEVSELRAENAALKKMLEQQGRALDKLSQKVGEMETANTSHQNAAPLDAAVPTTGGFNLGKVNLSGEGGIGFFNTGSQGLYPNSPFRVDEARLFLEAPVWDETYFYTEIDLATPESTSLSLNVNELYLDVQNVSKLWDHDSQLNFRAGLMNIPFGEEYLTRNAIDNPLVSRSLSDLWGVDAGVEAYGALGKFSYVVAVQNGGVKAQQDFNGDKSVTARIGFDPNRHWHFSVSGMRTGNLNAQRDFLSAEWFGNGFFRSIGSPATTTFSANMVEGDMTARWDSGHVSAFGGYARYNDNDPASGNGRDIYYYSVEAVQNLPKKFYAAARFSQILANQGYPLVGYGNFNDYFFNSLSTELWRMSLGLGYRFSDRLIIKTEYSFERGKETTGETRDHEDFFGVEAAFKF